MSHTGLMQESVEALLKQDRDCLWHHLMQHKVFQTSEPPIMVEGRGLILKDIRGREYLDATSGGVWCVNVGYGRDSIADAVLRAVEEDALLCEYGGKHSHDPVCPQGDFTVAGTGQGILLQQRLGGEREGLQDGSAVFPFEIQR